MDGQWKASGRPVKGQWTASERPVDDKQLIFRFLPDLNESLVQTVESPKGLPYGGLKGNQTSLRGAAPKKSLFTRGTSHGQIFQTNPLRTFHCFFLQILD